MRYRCCSGPTPAKDTMVQIVDLDNVLLHPPLTTSPCPWDIPPGCNSKRLPAIGSCWSDLETLRHCQLSRLISVIIVQPRQGTGYNRTLRWTAIVILTNWARKFHSNAQTTTLENYLHKHEESDWIPMSIKMSPKREFTLAWNLQPSLSLYYWCKQRGIHVM